MKYLPVLKRKVFLFLPALLALTLLAGSISPWMARAANPPSSGTVTLNPYSLWRSEAIVSHSVAAGSYRLLAVTVMIRADESVSSITYADEPLSLAKAHGGSGDGEQRVEIWYLVNPPVETANVIVHLASSANPSYITAVNFIGVNQTDPVGDTSGADATSGTTLTTNITTESPDSLIFGAASARGDDTDPFSPGASIIELWDSDTGGGSYDDDDGVWGGKLEAPTTGSYTFSATSTTADDWAIAAIELKAAPAPSFSTITADKTAYKDGDTVNLTVTLADNNTACTITADFSNIDDQYASGDESVVNWGTDGVDNNSDGKIDEPAEQGIYVVTYIISSVNGKADSSSYSVPVTATDGIGNSTASSTTLTLDNTAPPSPTGLTATALAGGNIQLSWTASSPETDVLYYNIYRSTSSGDQNYSSYTYQVSVGTATYTDTSTTDSTTYYYVVRAEDIPGNTDTNTNEKSATAGITTGPSFSSITADQSAYKDGDTTSLTVTLNNHNSGCTLTADFSTIDSQYVTGGEVVVNWGTDGKDNDGDGYIDGPSEQGIYVISYLISSVNTKADGSYSVTVTATDAATNSASSSTSLTLDNTAPPAPTSLSAAAIVGGSIQLSWTRSSPETDVTQYNVYRATASGDEGYSSPTYTVAAGISSYTDTATSNGQIYYYVVRAQDAAGNIETNTTEVSATSSGTGPPAPTALTALAITAGSIKLDWTLSSPETDVAQYNIYRAITTLGQWYDTPFANVSVGISTYTDTATTDGVTYYYVVRAQDAVGNNETNINEASATADATAPPAPTGFSATAVVGSGIRLDWTPSSPETDVSQYNIYRATSSGGQSYTSPTYTASTGNISYSDISVSDGQTYYYVLRAQDAAGNIETNANQVWTTANLSGPSVNVANIYLEYGEEILYDLATSTDSGAPTVFARGKIDKIYLRLNLVGGFEIDQGSSTIVLFKGIGDDAEEVPGSQNISQGTGWADFVFGIDPSFDPDVYEHSRDALYWVDISAARTGVSVRDLNFYFVYDTTSPAVPYFGIASFDPSNGRVTVSGTTLSDSSDPQQVEIFLNGGSQGVAIADGAGNFSKPNLVLASGDNYITVQSTDRAGNESDLSAPLQQRYNSQNLLSIVIRSSHVVKSGSATIPVEIIYAVTERAQVSIYIYNLLGETVKEWSEWVNPGLEPEWSWSGDNMYSETVNNGVYIVKVIADNGSGRREDVTKLLGVLR